MSGDGLVGNGKGEKMGKLIPTHGDAFFCMEIDSCLKINCSCVQAFRSCRYYLQDIFYVPAYSCLIFNSLQCKVKSGSTKRTLCGIVLFKSNTFLVMFFADP